MTTRINITDAQFTAALGGVTHGTWALSASNAPEGVGGAGIINPNSDVPFLIVESATGAEAYITYNQLLSPVERDHITKQALGNHATMIDIFAFAAELNNLLAGADALTVDVQTMGYIMKFFGGAQFISAQMPHSAYQEFNADRTQPVAADFSSVQADEVVTLTNAATGVYSVIVWQMGDGTIEWGEGPIEHTYTREATPTNVTARQIIIGWDGTISSHTEDFTIPATA